MQYTCHLRVDLSRNNKNEQWGIITYRAGDVIIFGVIKREIYAYPSST